MTDAERIAALEARCAELLQREQQRVIAWIAIERIAHIAQRTLKAFGGQPPSLEIVSISDIDPKGDK